MSTGKVEMTLQEIQYKLQSNYTGRVITFTTIRDKKISGKVQRITADAFQGELMVIFMMDYTRYEVDLQYFFENVTRHGNTPGTDIRSTGF